MPKKADISVFWFRRDLRLYDNTALLHALNSPYPVLPIFIFDPNILQKLDDRQDARVEFIYDQLMWLKRKLEEKDSTLFIFHDQPETVFKGLSGKYVLKHVFANRDYEPYAISRDQSISKLLKSQDISLQVFKDHLIFEGREILKQDGTPFKVFTPFKKVWLSKFEELGTIKTNHPVLFHKFLKSKPAEAPSLNSLGFKPTTIHIPPNEPDARIIREYDKKRNFPALDGTSRLGIHFRFGTVSIREKAMLAGKNSETWLNELIWREFYSAILQHFPYVTHKAFHKKYDLIPWKNSEFEFQKWCKGTTGYPIVDAGMRELNQTGHMHNRVRMIVASFLTKHLLVDWRWGEAYFAKKLLDFELASNNGGWQWAGGTGTDAQPYFRVFNPESQTQKFDPDLTYVKQWVPEFGTKSYPDPMVDHKSARVRAIETYKSVVSK